MRINEPIDCNFHFQPDWVIVELFSGQKRWTAAAPVSDGKIKEGLVPAVTPGDREKYFPRSCGDWRELGRIITALTARAQAAATKTKAQFDTGDESTRLVRCASFSTTLNRCHNGEFQSPSTLIVGLELESSNGHGPNRMPLPVSF